MGGLHPQSKVKRDAHLADMSDLDGAEPEPEWEPPPDEECDDSTFVMMVPGATQEHDRVTVVMTNHNFTDELVGFAVIQQTYRGGKWHDVMVGDSKHNQAHVHQYGSSTGLRIGDREVLMPINSSADVQDGYSLTHARVVDDWEQNKRRWENG